MDELVETIYEEAFFLDIEEKFLLGNHLMVIFETAATKWFLSVMDEKEVTGSK